MAKDSYYYYCLGEDSIEKGNWEESEAYYLKSLELGEHFKTHHKLSNLYHNFNKLDKAEYHLKQAFLLNPKNDKIALDYSKMIAQKDHSLEALEILESILKRNSTYGPAIKLKASLMKQQSETKK